MPILPIVLVAVGFAALAALRGHPAAPALPAAPGSRLGLVWREADVRAATCAAYAEGIDDRDTLAKIAADAIYPGRAWPPPEAASTRHKNIWAKIQQSAQQAIEGACAP